MKLLRRIGIAIAGGVVLMVGIAMIVLPGPAIVVIPARLAILAIEFAWARQLLHKMRSYLPKKAGVKNPAETPSVSAPGASSLSSTSNNSKSVLP